MAGKVISANEEWTVGEVYEMDFDISTSTLGDIFSIFNDDSRQSKIDSALRKVSEDPRLELLGYTASRDFLSIQVRAIQPSSPVMIVVWAIIGVAVLYAINLTLREVRKVIKETGEAVGPGGLNTTLVLIGAGAALYFFAVK